ncbi:MAG: sulfatase-like hydrolase/transferase [Bacteroidia bacterium]
MKVFRDRLKKYPFAPFLVVIFSFLHGVTYSFEWLRWIDLFRVLVPALGCVFILFLIFLWIFKSSGKSAVFTGLIAVSFFFFGYLLNGFGFIYKGLSHFKITAPVLLCLLILVFYWIKKAANKGRIQRVNLFFNLLFIVYIFVDSGVLGYKILIAEKKTFPLVHEDLTLPGRIIPNDSLPDIYFLVFDAYASSVSLKENYRYDNSAMDSFLVSNKFFISTHSKSNYSETPFSISSTLNMNYFKKIISARYPDDYPQACESMRENKLLRILESQGYRFYNLSIFDFKDHKSVNENFGSEAALKLILGKSMLNYFQFFANNILTRSIRSRFDNQIASASLPSVADKGSPKFIYLHMMLPHPPYYFNEQGMIRSVEDYSRTKDRLSVKSYLDQLTYTNTVIKILISNLLKGERNKIIVLEGDHGRRNMTYEQVINKESDSTDNAFKNLNAYYFYDKNYSMLYDSISPVNSFRVVMKQYFKMPVPLLKDTSIF